MLNENLVYKKRRERKMNKSPDNGITTSALKKIRMYIDRNSQLSPQVKHKLNYFFENDGGIPLDELNNSFMNGMINKEQHEQLRQIITPKATQVISSDQAQYNSKLSEYSRLNSSY